MIVSLARMRKRAKYVLFFIVLSYAMYTLLSALSEWAQPEEKYKAPVGRAVKVIQQEAVAEEKLSMKERLLFFYRYGE